MKTQHVINKDSVAGWLGHWEFCRWHCVSCVGARSEVTKNCMWLALKIASFAYYPLQQASSLESCCKHTWRMFKAVKRNQEKWGPLIRLLFIIYLFYVPVSVAYTSVCFGLDHYGRKNKINKLVLMESHVFAHQIQSWQKSQA